MVVYVTGTEWVDPYDPTVVAESELISAANSIEAAARKLSQLQPRVQVSKVATLNLFICRSYEVADRFSWTIAIASQ